MGDMNKNEHLLFTSIFGVVAAFGMNKMAKADAQQKSI